MGLKRNVDLFTGLRYRGKDTMLTFILHRVGGLGLALFLIVHILASFLDGKAGLFVNAIYENWLFQIFIFFCLLFHAINGLRITILDLWPNLIEHQREAVWIEWAVFLPLYAIAIFLIFRTAGGV
jgi:succinate dehydrogenase / fumarate reductase cytochrome b subunit